MDRYFRTEKGKLVDIIDYSAEQIRINPQVKIIVGCDSQVHGSKITYVMCIIFRHGTTGAHGIHKRFKEDRPPKSVNKSQQILERLSNEVYKTMELAQYISENSSIKIDAVEFDFNEEELHISNKLISMATGWAKGLGYNVRVKPEELLACKYADHLCRT
jgi:predicted RNase H-related nuclease YkuK (DUF458 family)